MMIQLNKIGFLILISSFALGCNKPIQEKNQGMYFDVQGLMFLEIQKLDKLQPGFSKTIVVNGGDPETISKNSTDWKSELQLFGTIDLNKENLRNLYDTAVDSNKELMIKRYTAKDTTLPIQEVEITMENGKLVLLTASTKKTSWIVDRVCKYSYQPGNGYSLTVKEDYFWKKPNTTEIFVQIKNPTHLIQ